MMLPFLQSQLAGNSGKDVIDLCLDYHLIASVHPEKFTEIAGLELFPDLQVFSASMQRVRELEGLKAAAQLRELDLSLNEISDISPVLLLSRLERLNLSHNEISEIGDFSSLQLLIELDLGFNSISDISGLNSLEQLEVLILNGNRGLTQLTGLPGNLKELHLSQCFVKDYSGMIGLQQLGTLTLSPGNMKNLDFLSDLNGLHFFHLNAKRLHATIEFPHLGHLKTMRVRHAQQVSALAIGAALPRLQTLEISHSLLESLPNLQCCAHVETLEISFSPLKDLNGVAEMSSLKKLAIKGTSIPPSIIGQLAKARPDLEIVS